MASRVHTVLALVPRGESERVLGLLHQEAWVRQPAARTQDGRKQSSRQRRERPRESEVWTRAVEQVGSPAPLTSIGFLGKEGKKEQREVVNALRSEQVLPSNMSICPHM